MFHVRLMSEAVWASDFRSIFTPENPFDETMSCLIILGLYLSYLTPLTHTLIVFSSPPGDFQFSVSSDDNSEFWLSSDESPLNARLLVYVGQVSTELCCTLYISTSE